jgi:hypothetical protein
MAGHAGQLESPLVIKHRKNLPSLNNGDNQSAHNGKMSAKGGSRGNSKDSSVPMAIQIQNSAQYTNGSGFLPGNSRENSQASGSHYSKPQYTAASANHNSNQDQSKINI